MNKFHYSIQFDKEDALLLMATLDHMIQSMASQLRAEAKKKRACFGLLYKPTPGLQHHERLGWMLHEMFKDVNNHVNTGGTLVLSDEGLATLIMANFQANRQHIAANRSRNPAEADKLVRSLDKLMAQMPLNVQEFRGGASFTAVHES